MRVLFISGVFDNDANGAARFAKLIYEKGGDSFSIVSEDTKGGNRIFKVDCKRNFLRSKLWQYFRVSCYRSLIYRVQKDFDVIVFNNPLLAHGFKLDKPTYVFIHDEKLMKVAFSVRFDYLRKKLFRILEKRVLESGIKVIANSRYISQRIVANYRVQKDNISLLYQGIRLDNKVAAFDDNLNDAALVKILFIKNDYVIGGLQDLIKALGEIKDVKFSLTIIGTDQKVKSILTAYDHVSYSVEGFVSNEEVIQMMYNKDILCIPARYEPLGVAVMEGLAVGIPTVTTNVGGLPEVTQNGKHVWACNPNDPIDLAGQLRQCIQNSTLRKEKSRHAKAFIHKTFDFDSVVTNLKSVLSEN